MRRSVIDTNIQHDKSLRDEQQTVLGSITLESNHCNYIGIFSFKLQLHEF